MLMLQLIGLVILPQDWVDRHPTRMQWPDSEFRNPSFPNLDV